MATVLLVGVDLYFRGKLEGLLDGHHLITTDSIDPPDIVIADIARIDPDEVADTYPEVPDRRVFEPHGHGRIARGPHRRVRPGAGEIGTRGARAASRGRARLGVKPARGASLEYEAP